METLDLNAGHFIAPTKCNMSMNSGSSCDQLLPPLVLSIRLHNPEKSAIAGNNRHGTPAELQKALETRNTSVFILALTYSLAVPCQW